MLSVDRVDAHSSIMVHHVARFDIPVHEQCTSASDQGLSNSSFFGDISTISAMHKLLALTFATVQDLGGDLSLDAYMRLPVEQYSECNA